MQPGTSSNPSSPHASALAIVLRQPQQLEMVRVDLNEAGDDDVVVDIDWSGISTGTEKLLWSGRMPPFPGLGYPLVPGYESVGRIRSAGTRSGHRVGEHVFVPGARCFGPIRGLFGGAASRLVVPGARAIQIDVDLGERAVLLALAATAHHCLSAEGARLPDLIVGHGVLGRLLARLAVHAGATPVVWEQDPQRATGAVGYTVIDPAADSRRDYRAIYDVSGDSNILDQLIARQAAGGEIVLAGFYSEPLNFAFAPAFMRETRLRVAAEWREADLLAVRDLAARGELSLDGLITHRQPAASADSAYRTAFDDRSCLKMILDWRATA